MPRSAGKGAVHKLRRVGPIKRWLGRTKRRLGYYALRSRLREPRFRRALRPTDVFLVGHPKSGNTWLAYMLAILSFRDAEGAITLLNVGMYAPYVHGRDHEIGEYANLPDPRIFRNEDPQYRELYPRIIYLVRDPRAVLVSFWHMYRTLFDDAAMTTEAFVDQYLSHSGCFSVWNRHLVRWDRQVREFVSEAERDDRITIVRYEDLVDDRAAVLRRLLGFLQIRRTDADVALAAERGSFSAMRESEDLHGAEAYAGHTAGDGRFVRAGTIDGWRGEMDPALAGRIESEFEPVMKLVGYPTSS